MPSEDQFFIGIDLGGTNIQAGVMGSDTKLIARDRTKTKADQGSDEVLDRLAKLVEKIVAAAKIEKKQIKGIGIGAPGALDPHKGIVLEAVNLRWNDFPLVEELRKRLDLPVTLDNDVNVGVWGEYEAGAGQGHKDLLAIFVGTGIGGGLILNGELHHGSFFTAGEIGHTITDPDASIGRRKLEDLASRTNIVNLLRQLILANQPSVIPELVDGNLKKIRSKVLADAVEKKDALTLEVIQHAAHYVGTAIANTVSLLSLPCVVVGGGLTEALPEDVWMKPIRESFAKFVFPGELGKKCKIVASKLEDDAGVVGAALLARQRLGK